MDVNQPGAVIRYTEASKITIPEGRQREDIPEDHISELASSINRLGLIHPIVVESDGKTLRAGECRLRAMRKLIQEGNQIRVGNVELPEGAIPFLTLNDVSERELFEIELEENIRRKSLTPQERAKAIARLHEFRVEEKGERQEGNPSGHTKSATAEEVARQEGREPTSKDLNEVSMSLLVNEHLDDPDVAKAPDLKSAYKVARKKLENQFSSLVGEMERTDRENQGESRFKAIEGDCCQIMEQLNDEIFDGIIVDPPYGVDASNFGSQTTIEGHEYEDDDETFERILESIASEGYRVCKPQAHMYMFCDFESFSRIKRTLEHAGWRVWRTPLIWDKGGIGHLPHPEHGPRRVYECLVYALKGDKKVQKVGTDVLRFSAVKDKTHAAEKPVELYEELIRRSFSHNSLILDPCAGAGTIFKAAARSKADAVGIEFSPKWYNIQLSVIAELEDDEGD